jgi:3',5'-cyclic AMP phosphodiesterase CpdA
VLVAVLVGAGTASADHLGADTEGHTTLEQALVPDADPAAGYTALGAEDVNDAYVVRDGASEGDAAIPEAEAGRAGRRRSLAYFSQLADLHVTDEESPARVESSDPTAAGAWRPGEALTPFAVDAAIRQVNAFAASPVPQGNGATGELDFALVTGDAADNQQLNETVWARDLLEGNGPLTFNSGLTDPAGYTPAELSDPACVQFVDEEGGPGSAAAEGARYTGVQDYDDYPAGVEPNPAFYDPDEVLDPWADAGWPAYDELMDTAQELEIDPAGLDVPFYLASGNHDVLAQGSEAATAARERQATGCEKPLAGSTATMLVPPDERRRFVSRPEIAAIYGAHDPVEEHGLGLVDADERRNSDGAASYYGWDPPQTPGVHLIALDTTSAGGGDAGSIDDPQFEWLKRELDAAQLAGELVVLFGHHPVRSLDSDVPDEAAPQCTTDDAHGHDVNPGCDLDPRSSEPLHVGDPDAAEELDTNEQTLTELLAKYPGVVAYVAGHDHRNRVRPFDKEAGGVWWEITTSAVTDFPQQHRLVELMDNRDGTLSIFATLLDHASPAEAPAPGNASGFDASALASLARTLALNDPQTGAAAAPDADGEADDRNVELLTRDPRALECRGRTATVVGSGRSEKIEGGRGADVILALGGKDRIKTGHGRDLVCGGDGADKLKGGGGRDELRGERGNDKLKGGKGGDNLRSDRGRDRLKGGKGRDRLKGGKGNDSCKGGAGRDRTRSC